MRHCQEALSNIDGCIHLRGEPKTQLFIYLIWYLLELLNKIKHVGIFRALKRKSEIRLELRDPLLRLTLLKRLQTFFCCILGLKYILYEIKPRDTMMVAQLLLEVVALNYLSTLVDASSHKAFVTSQHNNARQQPYTY